MKTRSGFVSNSSSTSFCIVGVNFSNRGITFEKVWAAEGKEPFTDETMYLYFGYGHESGKNLEFFGDGWRTLLAGVNAEDLLEKMSLPQARSFLAKKFKEWYNVDILENRFQLYYGEASSE